MYDTAEVGPSEDQVIAWGEHNAHADDDPGPDDEVSWPAPPATIKLAWETRERFQAELTPDQARAVFGLGGTPDDVLPSRIALLAGNGYGFANLHPCGQHEGTHSYKLTTIDGQKPSDF